MAYRDLILADNPVAYWRLADATLTTAADEKGANPGAYSVAGISIVPAGAGPPADPNRTVARFEGVNGRITVPSPGDQRFNPVNFTTEAWVTTQHITGTFYAILVARTLATNGIFFGRSANTLTFRSVTYPVGGTFQAEPRWFHVAATYDGNEVRLYMDGVPVGTPLGGNVYLRSPASGLSIGADLTTNTFWWFGNMADVAFYDYPLTAQQILDRASYRPPVTLSRTSRWTGSAWVPATANVREQSAWEPYPLKVWDGSQWSEVPS
jgi:hypothetical protein